MGKGNGGMYYYYEYGKAEKKHFRISNTEAHRIFLQYIGQLKPKIEVLKLYEEILKDIRKERAIDINNELEGLRFDLSKKEEGLAKLTLSIT